VAVQNLNFGVVTILFIIYYKKSLIIIWKQAPSHLCII